MPIRIAICDDEQENVERLSAALSSYDPSFEILAFQSGRTLVDEFLDGDPAVDLLFLDIYMPGLDGIGTAEKIHSRYKALKIIFLSSSKDHYPQAYEVFAFNLKSVTIEEDILKSMRHRAMTKLIMNV